MTESHQPSTNATPLDREDRQHSGEATGLDTAAKPIRVLVVDDSSLSRKVSRGVLTKLGFEVFEATDGYDAIDQVGRRRPDVILMDIMMPRMDGLECTRRLKAAAEFRDIPIIVISGRTDADDVAAGLLAGADEYLGKPLRVAELQVRIHTVVRAYRNREAEMRARQAEAAALALQSELDERRKMEQALRTAKEAAESASKAKSEFLATMSHELRTPLNGVIGMTELLLRTELDKNQRRFAEIAKRSGDTLVSLINDILDFSKIEAGRIELEHVAFEIGETLAATVSTLQPRASAKGLRLDTAIHPGTATRVLGDPGRLQQILMNLIGNAIKFTEQGTILVRTTVERESASDLRMRFTVSDTGIGIPSDRMDYLFQSFSQLDASTTRKYGGTGLGLAICRQLVELMGGSIGVSSELGRGSTFWFELPFERTHDQPAASNRPSRDLRKLLVLGVDDNATNRTILREQLARANVAVETVADADSALTRLRDAVQRHEPFGMVLLDKHMPNVDGLQLAGQIKNDDRLRDTILVLLSSDDGILDVDTLRHHGIAACLTKPVSTETLLDTMATALACAEIATPDQDSLSTEAHLPPSEPTRFRGSRVLLVDDNDVGREVGGAALSMLGCDFDVAVDGVAACNAVMSEHYDLVFMDCQMPHMDGFTATHAIRQWEAESAARGRSQARVPIIALTANAIKGDRERCIAAGMDDYLAKPFDLEDLRVVLERFLPRTGTDVNTHADLDDADGRSDADEQVSESPGPSLTQAEATDGLSVTPFQIDTVLERWNGNRSFVETLIRKFQVQASDWFAGVREAAVDRDAPAMVQAAHSLKGAAAYVSAIEVQRLAAELEEEGRTSRWDHIDTRVQTLEKEINRCVTFQLPHHESDSSTCRRSVEQDHEDRSRNLTASLSR